MALLIDFSKEKMFARCDFDVNSVRRNTDALKDTFKQTMLNQEIIFRKQVHELHRLYRVQITLMKDLGCKELCRYNSWKESTQSSLMPDIKAMRLRYEPPQKEPRLSSSSMVGPVPPISQELSDGCQGMHKNLQQKPFDLHFHASQYICPENYFSGKRIGSNHFKRTLESHVSSVSDAMDLTLSLGHGADSRRREGTKSSWLEKQTYSHPQFVIDLEDSIERISTGNAELEPSLGSTGLITDIGGEDGSRVCSLNNITIPRSVEKDTSHEIAVSSFLVDNGECCQEQNSSNQESRESQADITCNYMSIKKQQKLPSYNAGHLDLKKIQLDDLPCNSSNPMVAYLSAASSLGSSPEMDGRGKLSGSGETELSSTGLKSIISGSQMDLEEYHGSCCSDPNNRDKSTSTLQKDRLNDVNQTCPVTKQLGCEKSEVEDAVFSCSGDQRAPSCKSCYIVDNVSKSSSKKTSQSGSERGNACIPAVDQFSGTHVQSKVAEILSGEQHQKSSGSSENECINAKEESAELDVLIQRAAESLIYISLKNSAPSQDCTTRSGSTEIENSKTEQPQQSSDSFELHTLKLTESSSDDYNCVSSKAFEVNDTDKRDFGIKLKRGRRMKDFQKDILPGLACLSRHEILEDINILEGVLRSKEYKRNRARMMGDGERWSLPMRSRRKRLNYTQGRKFS